MEKIYKFRNKFDKVLTGPGIRESSMIDDYYNAAINAVKGTVDPRANEEIKKPVFKKPEIPYNGNIVYLRGAPRKGDHTENAPEVEIKGQELIYTYNGFTINYILPK